MQLVDAQIIQNSTSLQKEKQIAKLFYIPYISYTLFIKIVLIYKVEKTGTEFSLKIYSICNLRGGFGSQNNEVERI